MHSRTESERSVLLRWSFISALVLAGVTLLIYLGAVLYAQNRVGSLMGRGPSVSEEVNLIAGTLSLPNSCIVGLLILAAIALFWFVRLRRISEPKHASNLQVAMRASLIILPLAFSIAYALIRYVWFVYLR